jgi:hypothetical protein
MTTPGRPPTTDAELIRSLHERIRKLETAPTTRVGQYVHGVQARHDPRPERPSR